MSLAFYFDHHVPAAIAEGLLARGVDVLTTMSDGIQTWDDDQILQRATDLERLLFTQDTDFLAIAQSWLDRGHEFAGLVYGHQLRVTIGQAIRDLELIAIVMEPHEMRDRVEYLPLR